MSFSFFPEVTLAFFQDELLRMLLCDGRACVQRPEKMESLSAGGPE